MVARVQEFLLSKTLRVIAGVAGGNLLATLLGIVGSVVQARFVSPSDLGYFRGFSILTEYAVFLHLGIFVSIQRSYPLSIGRGDTRKAQAIAEVSQVWVLTVSFVAGSVFAVLALISLYAGNWRAAVGFFVQVVSISSFFYGSFLSATYRSGHHFMAVAKASVIASVAGIITLPLFAFWPYVALAVRTCVVSLVNLTLLHVYRPLTLKLRFSWQEWFALVREGAPIFFASYGASTGWFAVETTIVLHFLGAESLGLWSMSRMVLEAANKIPQAISSIYFPRVTEAYGRTGSPRDCFHLCRKPLQLGVPAMLVMAAVCSLLLSFLVPLFIPKYTNAVSTMCIMLLSLPLLVLEIPYALHVAMGNVTQQYIATYASLIFFIILSLIFLKLGLGLNAVVISSLFGRFMRLAFTYYFIFNGYNQRAAFNGIH